MFAQLTVAGKWEGPHVFMVRIRDDAMRPVPGVRIKDLGPKMGLNGVDNGQVRGGAKGGERPRGEVPLRGWGGVEMACMHASEGSVCAFSRRPTNNSLCSQIRLCSPIHILAWPPHAQLWFDHLRVPRDAMLDAYSSIDDSGAFHSTIPSVSQRFGTMVGGLTTGE